MKRRLTLAVLAAVTIAAPGHAEPATDGPPGPPVVTDIAVRIPAVREGRLKNGIRVLFVERHDLPLVSVRAVSTVGAADAPPGVAELASGTAVSSAYHAYWMRNLKRMNLIGASLSAYANHDSCGASVHTLGPSFEDAVMSLAEVVRVDFPDGDIIREARQQTIDRLEVAMTQSANYAARELAYPASHPYHYLEGGTAAAIRALEAPALRSFWSRAFSAANVTLTAAGDVSFERLMAGLDRAFGALPAGTRVPLSAPLAEPLGERRGLVLLHDPGATQARLTVIGLGVPYGHPDRLALSFAMGALDGRLHDRIRERYGSSYGVDATLESDRGTAPLWIYGSIENGAVATAIQTTLDTLAELRAKPVSKTSFEHRRMLWTSHLGRSFENSSDTSAELAGLAAFGLPFDYTQTLMQRVRALSPDDLFRAATRYLDPAHMRIVVVGDATVVGPELEKAGLGPIETRNGSPPKAPPR